jgi:hypothetical protein
MYPGTSVFRKLERLDLRNNNLPNKYDKLYSLLAQLPVVFPTIIEINLGGEWRAAATTAS